MLSTFPVSLNTMEWFRSSFKKRPAISRRKHPFQLSSIVINPDFPVISNEYISNCHLIWSVSFLECSSTSCSLAPWVPTWLRIFDLLPRAVFCCRSSATQKALTGIEREEDEKCPKEFSLPSQRFDEIYLGFSSTESHWWNHSERSFLPIPRNALHSHTASNRGQQYKRECLSQTVMDRGLCISCTIPGPTNLAVKRVRNVLRDAVQIVIRQTSVTADLFQEFLQEDRKIGKNLPPAPSSVRETSANSTKSNDVHRNHQENTIRIFSWKQKTHKEPNKKIRSRKIYLVIFFPFLPFKCIIMKDIIQHLVVSWALHSHAQHLQTGQQNLRGKKRKTYFLRWFRHVWRPKPISTQIAFCMSIGHTTQHSKLWVVDFLSALLFLFSANTWTPFSIQGLRNHLLDLSDLKSRFRRVRWGKNSLWRETERLTLQYITTWVVWCSSTIAIQISLHFSTKNSCYLRQHFFFLTNTR